MKKENVKVVKGYNYPNIDIYINTTCQDYPMQPKVWHTKDRCELIITSNSTGEILFSGNFINNNFYTKYIENTVQAIVSDDVSITDNAYREAARLYTLIIDTTQRENKHIVFIP